MEGMKILLPLLCAFAFVQISRANETSIEVLEEINLARTCPHQYALLLTERMDGSRSPETLRCVKEAVDFLTHAKPLPPLDFSDGLMLGAQSHVSDQGSRGALGHTGSDRSLPWDRMAKFGKWSGKAGENISYGFSDAKKIVAALIVDEGVPLRGHRKNIFSPDFTLAGIACGGHARFGSMCVIDFAGGFAPNVPSTALTASNVVSASGSAPSQKKF